jgi:magnesium transporter
MEVLPAESRAAALSALQSSEHPVDSAAQHVVVRVPVAREDDRSGDVLRTLASGRYDALEAVYVIDASGLFAGAVRLHDLIGAAAETSMRELMDRAYPRVGALYDQEHVAAEALEGRATSVAVISGDGRLVGAVPALSLLNILRHEHVEDLHRLAGVQREAAQTRSALEAPPVRRARHRLPWLLVGLAGSMLAAMVVARFERVLERNLAVAYFVPAIVYLADAIGTQTEAVVVRALSLSRLSLRHMLGDELRTGFLIGTALGTLAFPIVAFAFGDVRLGIAVAAAIVVAGSMATTIGLFLPWLLQRSGSDPAFGSGPVATIIQDVLSIVVYFAIATWIMS